MGYTATTLTLDHIVQLVEQERPEWDPAIVRIVLQSHTSLVDGTDLAIAALRLAQNKEIREPKAIGWRGPHWRGLATTPPQLQQHRLCGVCGKPEPQCVMVRPGPDDHRFEPRDPR